MKEYAWLFPILFIFHDMEEIVGFGIWLRKNKKFIMKKYPWAVAPYKAFSTEGMALAIYEELIVCIAFSGAVYVTEDPIISYIWLGALLGCTLHYLIHIIQALVIRMYIPAVITSIICLPVSLWIIGQCFSGISCFDIQTAAWILAGIGMVGINLKIAQRLIGWFTRKMNIGDREDQEETKC